ncbi:hypothetical protein MPTK1_6g17610 [Marchantia polymorpha subsp. ruderalis]|nr:hypothetical protein MARPO_0145s0025 [Marchantia polymorpha]BBN15176.1 hypothetical protein Mp_6g17610 [Marchantia polymorpha subsp. ruderalis]|eukprot:PTQ29259.1 hypothetical protein MARPO_0145s0025 [Marchantia polymorpha]
MESDFPKKAGEQPKRRVVSYHALQDETDVSLYRREEANATEESLESTLRKTTDEVELEELDQDVMLRELIRDETTSSDMREPFAKELATTTTEVVEVPKLAKNLRELKAERAIWLRLRANLERRLQDYRADLTSLTITRAEERLLSDSFLRRMKKFRAELDRMEERQSLRKTSECPGCSSTTGDSDSEFSTSEF